MSADDDLLRDFLNEGHENLDRLEQELLAFETVGASAAGVAAVFRTVHTIKGTAGFFGFERLQKMTHTAENLLDLVRDEELALTREIVSVLLEVADTARKTLGVIEATGNEGTDDFPALVARIQEQMKGGGTEIPPAGSMPAAVAAAPTPAAAPVAVKPVEVAAPAPAPAPAPVEATPAAAPAPAAPAPARDGHDAPARAETTVRVDIDLLEKVLDLAGELVLSRNQLLQVVGAIEDSNLAAVSQRINHITSELQTNLTKARMQPIGGAWSKLPRVVRDLAGELGKKVRLELEGADTGLDRTVLETIRDPLTHLVRNAVDHGIEKPERRVAAGKPAEGVLRLRASHEGGQVAIEIIDDGAGIDPARIRAKAIERGLISAERAAQLADHDVIQLIFAPGFSTAEKVTNVSGRGVGMDVVKTNIERIGGVVELGGTPGHGTVIRIKIPLTLAIIPTLIVAADGARYALPQPAVGEVVVVERHEIEHIHGAAVYRLRSQLLPLVDLGRVLGGRGALEQEMAFVVVVRADGQTFGLAVDDVFDSEEIVVKPLDVRLRHLPPYAGATILGDGQVVLVLAVNGLARMVGLAAGATRGGVSADAICAALEDGTPAASALLLVRAGAQQQVAMPLAGVARLEEFPRVSIERAGGRLVVQYRGRMLPLIDVVAALGYEPDPCEPDRLTVVVARAGDREVGLVIAAIVDIIEESVVLETHGLVAGLRGSAIVAGRVTDLIDVPALAAAAAARDHAIASAAAAAAADALAAAEAAHAVAAAAALVPEAS